MKFLQRLINNLRKLPGVGPKQAERFSNYILKASDSEIEELVSSIIEVKKNIGFCQKCFNFCVGEMCDICKDPSRSKSICVVETPFDIVSVEKTKAYNGRYFVLGRCFIPSHHDNDFLLRLEKLKKNIIEDGIDEVIIALDTTTEGQVTSLYIKKFLKGINVKLSRIAYGIPLGADLDYMDEYTLSHAIRGRVSIEE